MLMDVSGTSWQALTIVLQHWYLQGDGRRNGASRCLREWALKLKQDT